MSRVIVVTSGKGGVGKSSFSANIGSLLAMNNKVCLIDADLGLKNLDCILGLENRVVYDIEDVIENRVELNKALVSDKRRNNLKLLPACRTLDVTKVDFSYLEKIVNKLEEDFDYIIIDCPAGIERGFYNAINCASEAIIITTLDISALRDADKVIGILNKRGINNLKLVINKYNPEKSLNNSLRVEDVIEVLNIPLLGIIYNYDLMSNLANNGELVIDNKKVLISKCYDSIKRRIEGAEVEITKYKKRSFLNRLLS